MSVSRHVPMLALAALTAPAWAVTNVTVQLNVDPNFSGGTGPYDPTLTQTAPAELTSGLVTGGFNSSGTGHVFADIGTLRMGGTSEGSLNSSANGSYRDSFEVDLPGVATGTLITISFAIDVNGSMTVNDSNIADAKWQLLAAVGSGTFNLNASATLYNNSDIFGAHGYVGDAMGLQHGVATVPVGEVLPITVGFSALAQTGYDGHGGALGNAAFDFNHTVAWSGMSVALNGVARPDAVVTSASGFNYLLAAPVPEPGTDVLIGLGTTFLLWRRRMR